MAEKRNKQPEVIDLRQVFGTLKKKKKYFFIILPIVFVLSCAYILSIPRYYTTEIKLAPEMESSGSMGALGSIASNFGFDLGEMQTSDAITPLLYPELMEDNGFVSSLWNIKVEDKENNINTTYFDYLQKHQKYPWWTPAMQGIKNIFKSEDDDTEKNTKKKTKEFDPYTLTKKQDDIIKAIQGKVNINIDKKTLVISINVKDQSPVICKTVADTVKQKLQEFITDYRTRKARVDVEYYKGLTAKAKKEYEDIRNKYVHYADANTDVILESVKSKLEDMENDMQLKYNNYTMLQSQLKAAEAKVQERTPAFTLIQGAAVPIKPAGPKRMIFVLGIMIITTIIVSILLCRRYLMSFF